MRIYPIALLGHWPILDKTTGEDLRKREGGGK